MRRTPDGGNVKLESARRHKDGGAQRADRSQSWPPSRASREWPSNTRQLFGRLAEELQGCALPIAPWFQDSRSVVAEWTCRKVETPRCHEGRETDQYVRGKLRPRGISARLFARWGNETLGYGWTNAPEDGPSVASPRSPEMGGDFSAQQGNGMRGGAETQKRSRDEQTPCLRVAFFHMEATVACGPRRKSGSAERPSAKMRR